MIILLSLCVLVSSACAQIAYVSINRTHYIHEAREDFISVALDCTLVGTHWKTFNFTDPRVVSMLSGLSPAILRLGGTTCDYVVFNHTQPEQLTKLKKLPDYEKLGSILYPRDWDKLVQLASTANLTLLYDANVMLRTDNDQWDPSNFAQFLSYNAQRNVSKLMFELGNEPNNYPSHFNHTISGTQLAADFQTLKDTVRRYEIFKDSLVVGADVGNPYLHHLSASREDSKLKLDPATYIHEFFKSAHSTIDALTWHQYYLKGSTATVADFINATVMDTFQQQVDIVNSIVQSVLGPKATFPLWMGETSSAYNSGAANISNTYVAGFLWMDKLGVAARSGYDVVIRQTFYDGYYALIDHDLNPQPDYWLSLLYKQLVGRKSLNVTLEQGDVRVYASCTTPGASERPGSVTLYAMNLNPRSPVTILTSHNSSMVLAFNLEPTDGTLTSRYVNLNGKTLMLNGSKLPTLIPRWTGEIVLKPLTFGFFVLVDAYNKACM